MVEDAGRGWRKVVASPKPRAVRGVEVAAALINRGHIVIAAGGGGIPVVVTDEGEVRGVEAVIDKDYSASMLAASLSANLFIILTGVDRVSKDFGKPTQKELATLEVGEARRLLAEGQFPPGSMGPEDRRRDSLRRSRGPRGPGHAGRVPVGGPRGEDGHVHPRGAMTDEDIPFVGEPAESPRSFPQPDGPESHRRRARAAAPPARRIEPDADPDPDLARAHLSGKVLAHLRGRRS